MPTINVNFNSITAPLNKAQHGSGGGIDLGHCGISDFAPTYAKMHYTLARTHDWAHWNSGERIVDTHFVFPLEHLDPADPRNYYFAPTDDLIARYYAQGSKVLYRLGTSIEHSDVHYNTIIPKDFHHYAEILAGIVRHYTQGWANGFHYDMIFEIWNEADLGPKMWSGTLEEFQRFFVIVLKRLKAEFPQVMVGGPAYTTHYDVYLDNLLKACLAEGVTPDFISWHCYTDIPEYLVSQPALVRALLDRNGCQKTQTCINEWHYLESWDGLSQNVSVQKRQKARDLMHGIRSGVFNLAVLIGWQNTPLDFACYYGEGVNGTYGFVAPDFNLNKNFYSMELFGELLDTCHDKCAIDVPEGLHALAAVSADRRLVSVLIADLGCSAPQFSVTFDELPEDIIPKAYILDENNDCTSHWVRRSGNTLTVARASNGPTACRIDIQLN